MDTPFVSGSGLFVARVLVGKIGRWTGSDFFSVVPVPPERVFVGEMRFIIGFGFPCFVSISFGRVPVGEMGPLAGSIGGVSRLFPDPYRGFRRGDLFGKWVRFFLNLVGSALHLFLLNRLPIADFGFLRILHHPPVL